MAGPVRQRHLQNATIRILLVVSFAQSLAFHLPLQIPATVSSKHPQLHRCYLSTKRLSQNRSRHSQNQITVPQVARSGIPDHDDDDEENSNNTDSISKSSSNLVSRRRRWRFRKFAIGLLAFWFSAFAPLKYNNIKSASASAPVMAIPKAEGRDPAVEAMLEMERKQARQAQKELNDMVKEARRIEIEQGEEARVKYEQDYKATKKREAEAKAAGLIALKKDLLAQGICPFVDMEGQRQVINYRTGVDLADTAGTPFYMEKLLTARNSPKAYSAQKEQHRKVIACIVQDMKNRGIDALGYFEKHQDKTMSILDLPREKAAQLVQSYSANLELYGQIDVPKPGEMSVKEKIEASRDPMAEAKRMKEEKIAEAKRLKEEKIAEAMRLKQEKQVKSAELKASLKAEREKKKEEARLQKEKAKKGFSTTTGSVASATVALGTSAMQDSSSKVAGSLHSVMNTLSDAPTENHVFSTLGVSHDSPSFDVGDPSISNKLIAPQKKASSDSNTKIISPKVFGGIAIIGGGAVAFKMYRDKSIADELERERQFKRLMGNSDFSSKPVGTGDDLSDDDDPVDSVDSIVPSRLEPSESPAPVKKRRLGISLFNKKSNRETDINNLVAQFSPNAEFASLLAKLLTFGAPGRFPSVSALPGRMPMEEYNLEDATEMLLDIKGDMTQSDSVELFASVVNCMLIEILDLASSALSMKKGKEEATIDALNIVVDFMNHAAELFGAFAGSDVVIDPPVRYEGSLSKSKLEQMYGIYASAGTDLSALMPTEGTEPSTKVREDHDQRVAMLQDVFAISDKMAQGIITKASQKAMMEMMKNPEKMTEMLEKMGGMEGVQNMMKEMGADGMDPAMMEAMSDPEKLLPELKKIRTMVEAGTFPKSELQDIQQQLKTVLGSDNIEAALLEGRGAEDLTEMEKEFLEAMKVIMKA